MKRKRTTKQVAARLFSFLVLVGLVAALVPMTQAAPIWKTQGDPPFISSSAPLDKVGQRNGSRVPPIERPEQTIILWQQPLVPEIGYSSSCYLDSGDCIFAADDFENADRWSIESIFVQGYFFNYPASEPTLYNALDLNWYLFQDAGGLPSGQPGDGTELWSHTALPTDPEVLIYDGYQMGSDVELDLSATPLELDPGTYWLSVFASMNLDEWGTWSIISAPTSNLSNAQQSWLWDVWFPTSTHHDINFGLAGEIIPAAVELASFTAAPQGSTILLEWETATELDNLGFNLYRAGSASSPREQLNAALIPAQSPGSAAGAAYTFADETAAPGVTYHYWLEDVDVHGATTLHGPVSGQVNPLRRLLPTRPRLAPLAPVLRHK